MSSQIAFWLSTIKFQFRIPSKLPRGKDPDLGYDKTALLLASALVQLLEQSHARAFLTFFGTQVYQLLGHFRIKCQDDANVLHRGCYAILAALRLGSSRGHFPLRAIDPAFSWDQHPEVVRFIFHDIDQNTHLWYAIRPFLAGGSSLARIFGVNDYAAAQLVNPELSTDQPVIQLKQHLGLLPGEDFSTKQHFLRNGHTFEALGRELCASFEPNKLPIREFGTGLSKLNPTFSHSPDGIVWDGKPVAMIEVKCHSGAMVSSYASIPNIYLPQCIQGMIIHNVQHCHFVSVFYRPYNEGGRYVTLTIETLYRNDAVDAWFYKVLNEYSAALTERTSRLSDEFWRLFGETEKMLPLVRREPMETVYRDRRVPIRQLRLDLDVVLSKERRLHWGKQTFYREHAEVEREQLARLGLQLASIKRRKRPRRTWLPGRTQALRAICETQTLLRVMPDAECLQTALWKDTEAYIVKYYLTS